MDKPSEPTATATAVAMQLETLWQQGQRPDPDALVKAAALSSPLQVAEVLAADQWQRWHAGERISVEDYFARHQSVAADSAAALLLVYGEFLVREECGETPSADEYLARYPQCAERLRLQFEFHFAFQKPLPTLSAPDELLLTNGAQLDAEPAAHDHLCAFLAPGREPSSLGRLDHYEVLEVIGRGGMGVVFKARDTKLQRIVAIKMLAPQVAAGAGARKRFVREAQAGAAIRDDHVVSIYAVSDEGPVPYFVMEFIGGLTLEKRVRQSGPMEVREIVRIGMQTAAGLAAAHRQGLIHRDVKPANILLENGVQRVKIADFGLARVAGDANLTQRGIIVGTPLFMSPEQTRGEALDPRSDLFSLGSVLYMLCTGRPAFAADNTMAVLKRICEDSPRPIREVNPDIPEWLAAVVDRLLAKQATERFQSATELVDVLEQYLAPLQQSRLTPPAPPQRPEIVLSGSARAAANSKIPRRRKRLAAIALLLVGFAASLAIVAVLSRKPPASSPASPLEVDPSVLTVSQKPEHSGRFRTIQDALDNVEPGMTIRVLDDAVYDEYVLIDRPEQHRDVTLEATAKASIRRQPNTQASVWIRGVPDFTLRGFRILGTTKWDDYREIYITDRSAGVVVDQLDISKCASGGVVVYDVPLSGKDAPIVIQNCSFQGEDEAVVIKGRPHDPPEKRYRPQPCGHVVIRNNDFVRFNRGVDLTGEVHKVHIVGNRFRESQRRAIDLTDLLEGTADILIANNTMFGCESALAIWDDHAMGKPFLKCKNIRIQNNLVFYTDFPADLNFNNHRRGIHQIITPCDLNGLLHSSEWRFGYNWREVDPRRGAKEPERWIPLDPATDHRLKADMVLSINSNNPNFLRPAKDSPLAEGGAGVNDPALPAYVGATPPEGVEPWDWEKTWTALTR
jgi:serine/threonine protein kinase